LVPVYVLGTERAHYANLKDYRAYPHMSAGTVLYWYQYMCWGQRELTLCVNVNEREQLPFANFV
jgi:hypothetical protein